MNALEGTGGLSEFISSITGALSEFSTGNLGTILIAVLSATAVLGICWFAYRLIVRKVSGAMKKGKIG